MERFTIEIDGHAVEAEGGQTILQAALGAGVYIPHICSHDNLHPSGSCRLCAVEVDGCDGVQAACTTKAQEGMVVHVHGEMADRVRNLSMALMFSTHPDECVGCPKYLKCQLQALSQFLGASGEGIRRRANNVAADTRNPLMLHEMIRCILCGRCVRVCREVRGVGALRFEKIDGRLRVVPDGETLEAAGCKFCGACVEVCPTGSIRDQLEVFDFEKPRAEALVPCSARCPAGVDVPRYLRFVREGDRAAAAAVVREKAVFAEVLGYICNHFCQLECKRRFLGDSVGIRDVKRYACGVEDSTWKEKGFRRPDTGRRVAVVGGGPAGMTAAYYLRKCGHEVTLLEESHALGGQLRWGIPVHRLPREVVDREASVLTELGVQIVTGRRVQSVNALLDDGCDAALVAVGTHSGVRLPIEGADLAHVYVNADFLRAAAAGEPLPVGERVVVLGGGNVACDCAGVALRLGAKEVHMACLEKGGAIPADPEELEAVRDEGAILHDGVTFTRIAGENGRASGVELLHIASFTFDENRRAVIETQPDSQHLIPCDTVIFAVGQRPDLDAGFGLELGAGNRIVADASGATGRPGVFAAGDAVTGTASVVEAIAAARRVAAEMDRYLGGDGDLTEHLAPLREADPCIGRGEGFAQVPRQRPDWADPRERCAGFDPVDPGLGDEQALCEAARCLQCDLRLQLSEQRFWSDYAVHV